MGTKKINSLKMLRERKQQISEQLSANERQIKYGFYLYTHPIEWIANVLTNKNLPVTSRSFVKIASTSSRLFRYGKIVYSVIKFLRKK